MAKIGDCTKVFEPCSHCGTNSPVKDITGYKCWKCGRRVKYTFQPPTCTECGTTENLQKIETMKPRKTYFMCTQCMESIEAEQEEMAKQDMEEYYSIVWGGLTARTS